MVHARTTASIFDRLRLFGADARGVAGIEFAITGSLLVLGLLNAVDVGYYAYQRMEVENAAEVGAQAAWKTCTAPQNPMLPATQNCPGLNNAITSAIQSTTLGKLVSLTAVSLPTDPFEDYRCVNASNVLQSVGSVSSPKPANCSAAGNAAATPGDYIQVGATYPYQPLFPGPISVMSVSGVTSITKTSWMRMG